MHRIVITARSACSWTLGPGIIMNLKIEFKEYLLALSAQSNRPLSMAVVLSPLGLCDAPTDADSFLLVGHLLDALAMEYLPTESIDIMDVLRVADDLGAEATAELGPMLAA